MAIKEFSIKKTPFYRLFEQGAVYLFLLGSLVLTVVLPQQTSPRDNSSPDIIVIASAMPNQGWTPLTVYFSAFGSESLAGSIVRYQWDLDGNGILDTDSTREGGYAQYSYNKPGEYQVKLQVTDNLGNSASETIPVIVRHPGSSSVDYQDVFDDSLVRRVTVSLTQANWDLMWSDIEAKIEVPADAVVFGERLQDVGFRMRGQFSLRESGQKKPWVIDTDAYIRGQEFENMRQLLFVNAIGDASLMEEKLAYEMMQFAGVPASHATYVDFWIDISDDDAPPEFWGIYIMIERVDRKFIGSRFGRGARDGNLYKANLAQLGPMDLKYHGPEIEDYPSRDGQYAYGKENNMEDADYSDIINLCHVIDGARYASPEDFARALEAVFNVDGYLRYQAVIHLTMNWDYYLYTGNNYYLFNNPETGRFEWIPWDLTWGVDPMRPVMLRGEVSMSEHAPLYEHVFEVERYRRQHAAYLDLLMRHVFNYEHMYARVKMYHDMLGPYLYQGDGDKMYTGEGAWFTLEQFESSWEEKAALTESRTEYVQELLEQGFYRAGPADAQVSLEEK